MHCHTLNFGSYPHFGPSTEGPSEESPGSPATSAQPGTSPGCYMLQGAFMPHGKSSWLTYSFGFFNRKKKKKSTSVGCFYPTKLNRERFMPSGFQVLLAALLDTESYSPIITEICENLFYFLGCLLKENFWVIFRAKKSQEIALSISIYNDVT